MKLDRHAASASTVALITALCLHPHAAFAASEGQSTSPIASGEPAKPDDGSEIVVTGTSIRGLIAPVGAPTISVDKEAVRASGATNTVDLLASIPQISAFGTAPRGNARRR